MKRNYNLRLLKAKKSYSTQELSKQLGVHVQTVRGWGKTGMKSIDKESHFALYLGSDVKAYLKADIEARRVHLDHNEFYCMGCKQKTTSLVTTITSQNKTIGRNMESVKVNGICVHCGTKVCRFDVRSFEVSTELNGINKDLPIPL